MADVLLDWAGGVEVDENRLQHDISQFVDQYRGVPLKDLRIGLMLGDHPARSYSLTLPADLALMIKAFLTLEGMGRQLDPDFDMASAARPFLERVVLQRYAPRALLARRRSLLGLVDFGELPRDLRKLVQAARRGRLQLKVETTALQGFGEQVNRAANRLVVGVITAALIIGSSIVMHSVGGVSSRWLLALGVCGFIGAGFCGVWILVSIWRSGKHVGRCTCCGSTGTAESCSDSCRAEPCSAALAWVGPVIRATAKRASAQQARTTPIAPALAVVHISSNTTNHGPDRHPAGDPAVDRRAYRERRRTAVAD